MRESSPVPTSPPEVGPSEPEETWKKPETKTDTNTQVVRTCQMALDRPLGTAQGIQIVLRVSSSWVRISNSRITSLRRAGLKPCFQQLLIGMPSVLPTWSPKKTISEKSSKGWTNWSVKTDVQK